MSFHKALYSVFFVFLIFPYLYLSLHFLSNYNSISQALAAFDSLEFVWAAKNSFLQAGLSAIGSLIVGTFLCFGVYELRYLFSEKYANCLQQLLILPSLLPALFSILCLINLVEPYPIGIIGVVLIHVFMNAGLVSFFLDRVFKSKLATTLELSYTEGASKLQYLNAVKGWVAKDVLGILFFVFVICFTSLSVPLLAGGGKATSLEVLIYEKIKISGNFDQGLLIAIFQLLLVFTMSRLPFSQMQKNAKYTTNFSLLKSKVSMVFLLLFIFLPMLFFIKESIVGWNQVQGIPGLLDEVQSVLPTSIAFAVVTGLIVAVLLVLIALAGIHTKLFRLVLAFVSPSTALLSLALLLMLLKFSFNDSGIWPWVLWSVGFAYLVFPTLFRWGWYQEITALKSQIEVANLLGAGSWMIFSKIILPQISRSLALLSGIGAFWALGDFAIGKFLIGEPKTLAMLIESLLSAYRLQAALALMGLLLLIGLGIMLLFYGVESVYRREFEKEL